jgi:hypothetical protein
MYIGKPLKVMKVEPLQDPIPRERPLTEADRPLVVTGREPDSAPVTCR